jgi:hypothetical protein
MRLSAGILWCVSCLGHRRIHLFSSTFNSSKGTSVWSTKLREGRTPEIIPGRETRGVACRGVDSGSPGQSTFPAGITHPQVVPMETCPPPLSMGVNHFAIRVTTIFFFFLSLSLSLVILEAFTWIFPCSGSLYVSIILGGLVSDRQQRQLVLTESMCSWRKCGLSRCHPTHGKEVTATQGGEMYGLSP